LPKKKSWDKALRGKVLLLAVITPCVTRGQDATKVVVKYSRTTTDVVTDLQAVECVVGRAFSRKGWGIIDRSGDFSRTEFIPTRGHPFTVHDNDESVTTDWL
jgi:hypothetical protein